MQHNSWVSWDNKENDAECKSKSRRSPPHFDQATKHEFSTPFLLPTLEAKLSDGF